MRAAGLARTEHGSQLVLVFDRGDEVVEQLTAWCNEHAEPSPAPAPRPQARTPDNAAEPVRRQASAN
jgi:hypothetical protein